MLLLLIFNCLAFLLYGWDKFLACKGKRRVPERILISSAACFGAAGALIAMYLFHHKTRIRKFTIAVPIMMVLQIMLVPWVGLID